MWQEHGPETTGQCCTSGGNKEGSVQNEKFLENSKIMEVPNEMLIGKLQSSDGLLVMDEWYFWDVELSEHDIMQVYMAYQSGTYALTFLFLFIRPHNTGNHFTNNNLGRKQHSVSYYDLNLDLELDVLSHIFDADPLTCNVTSELDLDLDIHQMAELGNVTIIKDPDQTTVVR